MSTDRLADAIATTTLAYKAARMEYRSLRWRYFLAISKGITVREARMLGRDLDAAEYRAKDLKATLDLLKSVKR